MKKHHISFIFLLVILCPEFLFCQSRIYWSEVGTSPRIRRAKISDPTINEVIYDSSDGLVNPVAIALDVPNGDLYWVEDTTPIRIMKGKMDGSQSPQGILSEDTGIPELDFSTIRYLVVDGTNGKLYWSDRGANRVQSSSLTGSNLGTVVSASGPEGIALNAAGTMFFRGDAVFGEITVLDLTSGAGSEMTLFSGTTLVPMSLVLGDSIGKFFWHNRYYNSPNYEDSIQTGDAAGTGSVTTVINFTTAETIGNIFFNNKNSLIYFTESTGNKIDSVDLSGNRLSVLSSSDGVTQPHAIAIEIGCPNDTAKDEPGTCGCGVSDADSDSDGVVDCLDTDDPEEEEESEDPPVLGPDFVIEEAPEVQVTGRKATIIMQEFSGVSLETQEIGSETSPNEATKKKKKGKLKFKYLVVLKRTGDLSTESLKSDLRRRITKRNELTFKNLSVGAYSTKYRMLITRKDKVVSRTSFSPSQTFEIEE